MRKATFHAAAITVAIACLADPMTAAAHGTGPGGNAPAGNLQGWALAGLAAATCWYALGVRRMEQERAPVVGMSEMAAFAGGVAVLFMALVSPIDTLAATLFSVHMVQHLLLMLAAPPLLVRSRAPIVFLWAFTRGQRRRIGRWWKKGGLAGAYSALMHPAVVWSAFTGALVLWHVPAMYQGALANPAAHTVEHLSFFVTSLAFWTLVIEPSGRRRLGYGAALMFVATTAVLGGLPGALMVLAPRPLYPAHAAKSLVWGLTPMEDQQIAGLLMWIPAGFVYVGAICWLFRKWLDEAGRKTVRSRRLLQPAAMLAFSGPVALAGGAGQLLPVGEARSQEASAQVAGDSGKGAALIARYGCGGCHVIPGIAGAEGLVGPPLNAIGRRVFIAGTLRNSPDNMTAWLEDPQRFVPGNAMPGMGISRREAQDMTAYLYTLR